MEGQAGINKLMGVVLNNIMINLLFVQLQSKTTPRILRQERARPVTKDPMILQTWGVGAFDFEIYIWNLNAPIYSSFTVINCYACIHSLWILILVIIRSNQHYRCQLYTLLIDLYSEA